MRKFTRMIPALVLSVMLGPLVCLADINEDLTAAVNRNDIQKVKELLASGADVDAKDIAIGCTPLMWAAANGYVEVAKLLIEKGADVNAQGPRGYTPLMQAASTGEVETAKLLIEKGADVNAKNNFGATALSVAEKEGLNDKVAQLIREAGGR